MKTPFSTTDSEPIHVARLRRTASHPAVRPIALAVASFLGGMPVAWALPTAPQVASGQVGVSTSAPGQMNISQGTAKAIVNWGSFSVGANEAVRVSQPAGGQALFRVVGNSPSQILGQLTATGHLFLVNPTGVLFGSQARVDVGSLTASTLNLSDGDFKAGRWRFTGNSTAAVVNQGRITADSGGSIALIGREVSNTGQLLAPQGSVALGAGSDVALDLYGNGLIKVHVIEGGDAARASTSGLISTEGGLVSLAANGTATAPAAINVSGLVRANGLVARDGAIFLSAGPGGSASVNGSLDVSGLQDGAHGGRIEVTGGSVSAGPDARLDASGAAGGGNIFFGGGANGRDATIPNASASDVAAGAIFDASATQNGDGGTVVVWSDGATRFAGSILARGGREGGNGGNAEVSGLESLQMNGSADLSAPAGRFGNLLLDPGTVSIVHSAANVTGPDTFADAALAGLLQNANVTVATSAGTNNADETIFLLTDVNVAWNAATTLTLSAGRNIIVDANAVIQNTNSGSAAFDAIVLRANRGATQTAGTFIGISVAGTARLETARGNIVLDGRGGTAGNFNEGVLLAGTSVIRTADGKIGITGAGGGNIANSVEGRGISIEGSALVEATGTGAISLSGTGGSGVGNNVGVVLLAPTIRTASGALQVIGQGAAGAVGAGVVSQGTSTISSTTGSILIRGVGATANDIGLGFFAGPTTVGGAGTSGSVSLLANIMQLNSLSARTSGTMSIAPVTAGRTVNLGGPDTTTALGISTAELGRLSAGRLEIGSATSGALNVSAAITPTAGTGTLALLSSSQINVNAPISGGASRLALSSGGGVTLASPLTSNAANVASTRAISIRAQGVFNNTVGAGALSTPNGSWTVSLPTPQGQNFNGLLSGNTAVWSNPVTANVNPTGNRYSFAIAPTIFFTAGNVSKVYGDVLPTSVTLSAVPAFSVADTFGGVFTDYSTGTVSGSYTRSSSGLAAAANVGSYAVSVTSVAGLTTDLIGYGFVAGSGGVVSVTPRPLTVSPDAVTRVFGDANPLSATASGNNLVNGDTLASVAIGTTATSTSNVGNYATTGSAAVFATGLATNYAITYASNPNGLVISQRALTVTPDVLARVYGDATPARGTASAAGLVGTDNLASVALVSPATVASGVGAYSLTGADAQFTSGAATNYAITYALVPNGLLIQPRPLVITALSGQGKFVGAADPLLTYAVAGRGLANGDTLAGALARNPGELPGAYPIGIGSLAAGSNYTLTFNGADFVISTVPVSPALDRAPSVGRGLPSLDQTVALLDALPPTAAGGDTMVSECVRDQALDSSGLGTARYVVRGIRLPEGVVNKCW